MGLADQISLARPRAGIRPGWHRARSAADRRRPLRRPGWTKGYHGEMAYLARPDAVASRHDLSLILPGVRSVVAVGINYHSIAPAPDLRADPSRGIIASYAWGDDYHDLLTPRLAPIGRLYPGRSGPACRLPRLRGHGSDSGARPCRRRRVGLYRQEHQPDPPTPGLVAVPGRAVAYPGSTASGRDLQTRLSGRDRRCPTGLAEAAVAVWTCCPTAALVAPYVVDARRCISYLTIELKGSIPRELRPLIGNHIFGCDVCQEVCPWNRRFARPTAEAAFQPRSGCRYAPAARPDGPGRGRAFDKGLPAALWNGPNGAACCRNVAVALGNWGDPAAVPALTSALRDPEPLIRGHAAWALGRIATVPQACLTWSKRLLAETDEWVREELKAARYPVDVEIILSRRRHMPNLFSPFTLRSLTLRNRIMMSPMCMYSAAEDGQATDWHLAHYVARAAGGVGLVVTEATAVEPRGRISRNDLGLWDDAQVEPLARIARLVQAEGAAMGVQLAHAGRKAFSAEKGHGPQMPVAPSALPFDEGWCKPHELDDGEIDQIVAAWQSAAARALAAGLDVIEIHGAHGYLGHQFLSPLANRRTDAYGGPLAHRMRFLLRGDRRRATGLASRQAPLCARLGHRLGSRRLDTR